MYESKASIGICKLSENEKVIFPFDPRPALLVVGYKPLSNHQLEVSFEILEGRPVGDFWLLRGCVVDLDKQTKQAIAVRHPIEHIVINANGYKVIQDSFDDEFRAAMLDAVRELDLSQIIFPE